MHQFKLFVGLDNNLSVSPVFDCKQLSPVWETPPLIQHGAHQIPPATLTPKTPATINRTSTIILPTRLGSILKTMVPLLFSTFGLLIFWDLNRVFTCSVRVAILMQDLLPCLVRAVIWSHCFSFSFLMSRTLSLMGSILRDRYSLSALERLRLLPPQQVQLWLGGCPKTHSPLMGQQTANYHYSEWHPQRSHPWHQWQWAGQRHHSL